MMFDMKRWMPFIGVDLNGVSYQEKLLSVLGGLISISFLIWFSRQVLSPEAAVPVIASMGSSAVLLFAMPHGPSSQPWPVLAGHGLSALIGVLCARFFGHGWLSAGCAVGLSIGLMHQLRCLHPPAGATALTAVIGGEAIHRLGFQFAACPVLTNAVVMLVLTVAFNWPFVWRRYPVGFSKKKEAPKPSRAVEGDPHQDIVKALKSIDSFTDVHESDLTELARMITREREAWVTAAKSPSQRSS
jgi:CBS-domain-containing membrane protein